MQTQNRLFDDLARVAGGAMGAVSGLREEIELIVRGRIERVLADMELVTRDEFDAVKEMAAEARAENDRLAKRIEDLETKIAALSKTKAASATTTRRRGPHRPAATAKPAKTSQKPSKPETDE